jgi:hypothetical protein
MKVNFKLYDPRVRVALGVTAMLATTLVFAGAAQLIVRQAPSSQHWDSANMQRLLNYHLQVSRTAPLVQPIQQQLDMRQLLIGSQALPGNGPEER